MYMAHRVMIGDEKDPLDLRDYTIDWRGLLGLDTITTSLWLVPPGLTGVSAGKTTTSTSVFVSGGVENEDYLVLNRILTTDGRQFERALLVPVREL
jgi:hypothetical protein